MYDNLKKGIKNIKNVLMITLNNIILKILCRHFRRDKIYNTI